MKIIIIADEIQHIQQIHAVSLICGFDIYILLASLRLYCLLMQPVRMMCIY